MDNFSDRELAYLAGQRLGRLTTLDRHGTPQNSPVGFQVAADGTEEIRIHHQRIVCWGLDHDVP